MAPEVYVYAMRLKSQVIRDILQGCLVTTYMGRTQLLKPCSLVPFEIHSDIQDICMKEGSFDGRSLGDLVFLTQLLKAT